MKKYASKKVSSIIASLVLATSMLFGAAEFVHQGMSTPGQITAYAKPSNSSKKVKYVKGPAVSDFCYSFGDYMGVKGPWYVKENGKRYKRDGMWYARIKGNTLEVYGSGLHGLATEAWGDQPQNTLHHYGNVKRGKYYFKLTKDYKINDGASSADEFNKAFKKRKTQISSDKLYSDYYPFVSVVVFFDKSGEKITSIMTGGAG